MVSTLLFRFYLTPASLDYSPRPPRPALCGEGESSPLEPQSPPLYRMGRDLGGEVRRHTDFMREHTFSVRQLECSVLVVSEPTPFFMQSLYLIADLTKPFIMKDKAR